MLFLEAAYKATILASISNVVIKDKELRHYSGGGGRQDILAYNPALDTYYEIEAMLGECDADHRFRVLDYWARGNFAGQMHVTSQFSSRRT